MQSLERKRDRSCAEERGGFVLFCFCFFKRVAYLKKEKKKTLKKQILGWEGGKQKGPADKASLGAWCILGTDRAKRF